MNVTHPAIAYALGLALGLAACGGSGPAASAPGSPENTPPPTVTASGTTTTSDKPEPDTSPPGDDQVKITQCVADETGSVTVRGYVKNTTGHRVQNLNVIFEIVDPTGTRLATVFGSVDLLAAGQRARFTTNYTDPISGKFTCRLLQVTAG